MTSSQRGHGEGHIVQTGEGIFRIRYRIAGKRYSKNVRGNMTDARKALRAALRSGDTGEHVDPNRLTVGQWLDQWIAAGAPGRRKKRGSARTVEGYSDWMRLHVKPTLGDRPLQKLTAPEIDALYLKLEAKLAPRTRRHVHVTFNAALATAERKGLLLSNPMRRVEAVPSGTTDDQDLALDEVQLAALVSGFKKSRSMYAPVAVAAATGLRRGELLGLRWADFDPDEKTLRVERALEQTKKHGIRFKPPKTWRSKRVIGIDNATCAILLKERDKHLRIKASVPDGADVDLSLIKLPEGALIFPAVPASGEDFEFTKPRNPRNFSKEFARRAGKLGFGEFTFHGLRGTHATLLLDRGVPVHTVAERIGDDPATLLRSYAKRKRNRTADTTASAIITALAAAVLK